MDEIQIKTIEWTTPEYKKKERTNDWFWAVGLVTIVACVLAVWFHNYVFAIFLLLSGASLVMLSITTPQHITYTIETKGLSMGREKYPWKKVKGFNIKEKEGEEYSKLIIELDKYFLPIYRISVPHELIPELKENLLKVTPRIEIDESKSMMFMEKLGF